MDAATAKRASELAATAPPVSDEVAEQIAVVLDAADQVDHEAA